MSIFSLFLAPTYYAFDGTVDNPTYSRNINDMQGSEGIRYNLLFKKTEKIALDEDDTRTLTLPESTFQASEWSIIMLKVVGNARLTTTGLNYDGISAITGMMDSYGTELFPGYIILSTYNVSAFVLKGLADDTTLEVFYGVSCADADARYD